MASVPSTPTNFYAYQGNNQVYVACDLTAGASSYIVQRSIDGVNYTNIGTPTLPNYTDTTVTQGTMYWYQMASVNSTGTSNYTAPTQVVPSISGELSLFELRLRAKQRADRINSNFVTTEEWNHYLNQSLLELYDMIVTVYEDYFVAPAVTFQTNGSNFLYPVPNGILQFTDPSGSQVVAPPIYKLIGMDNAINTSNNAYITLKKYNFRNRNMFVFPNTMSTIYGVWNLRYRWMGSNIQFIPTPSGNQTFRIWYIPRLAELIKDTDITTLGFSGWLEYAIVRAAKYALDKEESDTTKLDTEILFLKQRIEAAAANKDAGEPDTITDVRQGNGWGYGSNNGDGFFNAGY